MINKSDIEAFFDMQGGKTNADLVYEYQPELNNGNWSDSVMHEYFDQIERRLKDARQVWAEDIYRGFEEDVVISLIDILYPTYGALLYLGVDPDEAFRRVHDARMNNKPMNLEDLV